MKSRLRRCRMRGLTLLELLLTVVIFSLVITIFSQAVFQISLFERASARSMGGWQRQWASGFALDDYFRGLVLAPDAKESQATGSARSFVAWWVEQAGGAAGRPVQIAMFLREIGSAGKSESQGWGLFAAAQESGGEVLLARWNVAVSFEFINSAGLVDSVWPPLTSDATTVAYEVLPRAVRVVNAQHAIMHQWVYSGLTQPGLARMNAGAALGLGVGQ